jgi:hypothetical protein
VNRKMLALTGVLLGLACNLTGCLAPPKITDESPVVSGATQKIERALIVVHRGVLDGQKTFDRPATDTLIAQFAPAAPKVRSIVSALLLRSAGGGPAKLIHSSPIAASQGEALGVLTRSARQKFPGYTIEMTAAAPLSIPSVACFKEGKPADGQALYIVSAVLSEGVGSSTPAMLINGSSYTFSADDARKRFLSEVAEQYPNPAPLEVLATEQKNVVPTPCSARGKWGAV